MKCFNRTYALQTYEKSNFSRHKKEQPSKNINPFLMNKGIKMKFTIIAFFALASGLCAGWGTPYIVADSVELGGEVLGISAVQLPGDTVVFAWTVPGGFYIRYKTPSGLSAIDSLFYDRSGGVPMQSVPTLYKWEDRLVAMCAANETTYCSYIEGTSWLSFDSPYTFYGKLIGHIADTLWLFGITPYPFNTIALNYTPSGWFCRDTLRYGDLLCFRKNDLSIDIYINWIMPIWADVLSKFTRTGGDWIEHGILLRNWDPKCALPLIGDTLIVLYEEDSLFSELISDSGTVEITILDSTSIACYYATPAICKNSPEGAIVSWRHLPAEGLSYEIWSARYSAGTWEILEPFSPIPETSPPAYLFLAPQDTLPDSPVLFVYWGGILFATNYYDTSEIVESSSFVSKEFSLSAYPNPFNSVISITAPEGVGIEIFDINGRSIATLPGGEQVWQPEPSVGSGIYLVRAKAGEKEFTKRVVYLK